MSSMVSVSFSLAFKDKAIQIQSLKKRGLFTSFGNDIDVFDISSLISDNKVNELRIDYDDGITVMVLKFKDHYSVTITKDFK